MNYRDFFVESEQKTPGTQEPHCVMVNIPEGAEKNAILQFIAALPEEHIYDDAAHEYGRETTPHVTVLYGLAPSEEAKAKQMLAKIPKGISATLGKISKFSSNDKPYDVLKVEVSSSGLTKIHQFLRKHCKNNWEWPSYSPHMTLAYVKKGTCENFVGDARFSGKSFTFDSFVYNNGVSGHKEKIAMNEYAIGQGGGYGGAAGGAVAPGNWAGTPVVPQTSRRMNLDSASRRTTYMQGNTVIGSSLYDTITGDDLKHPQFDPAEIFTGLRHEMKKMEFPDKNIAREEVIKNLQKNPKYYSDLGMYFDNPKQGPQT